MADIFISFRTDDTPRVQAVHDAFRARGLTVFWSNDIPKGAPNYQAIIKDEILKAPVVVAVWTNESVHSGPVIQECSQAEKVNKLFQVLLDDIEPIDMPMEVKYKAQKTMLVGWTGDRQHREWVKLNEAIDARLGRRVTAIPGAEPQSLRSRGLASVEAHVVQWGKLLRTGEAEGEYQVTSASLGCPHALLDAATPAMWFPPHIAIPNPPEARVFAAREYKDDSGRHWLLFASFTKAIKFGDRARQYFRSRILCLPFAHVQQLPWTLPGDVLPMLEHEDDLTTEPQEHRFRRSTVWVKSAEPEVIKKHKARVAGMAVSISEAIREKAPGAALILESMQGFDAHDFVWAIALAGRSSLGQVLPYAVNLKSVEGSNYRIIALASD